MTKTDVLIIGGGISGLSTAWWLTQQGIDAVVWEASNEPGGKIRSTLESGYLTERAAGMIVNYRAQIDLLLASTGLVDRKLVRNDALNRYILKDGELRAIPMQLPKLLASPLWSLRTKLRLMSETLIPPRDQDGESVSSFIRRRLGSEVLETAMDPFVTGTLGSDPDLAEARAVLPRLTQLERRYGSITLGMVINRIIKRRRVNNAETFSFPGGMSELCLSLAGAPGLRIRYGINVSDITDEKSHWRVRASSALGEQTIETNQLVMCTPAGTAGSLLAPTNEALAKLLLGIDYSPISVVHLGLKRSKISHPLDGTGFLVPKKSALEINGNLWMNRLFPERAPAGSVLLTSYMGGVRCPEAVFFDDQRVVESALSGLAPVLGIRGDPEYVRIDRHTEGLPLYHGRYVARTEQIKLQVEKTRGLHLSAGYAGGVSVRERIYQGRQTAKNVIECLNRIPRPEMLGASPLAAGR